MIPGLITLGCIRTHLLPANETRPARILVYEDEQFGNEPRRLVVECRSDLTIRDNHYVAAQKWLDKHNPHHRPMMPGLCFEGEYYWAWEA